MTRTGIALLSLVAAAAACTITFTPPCDTGVVGETLHFKVLVANIHIPCLIGIEPTEFAYQRLHLAAADSVWTQISVTRFTRNLTVVLDSAGTGAITVTRVCPIRTSTGSAGVLIRPAPAGKKGSENAGPGPCGRTGLVASPALPDPD